MFFNLFLTIAINPSSSSLTKTLHFFNDLIDSNMVIFSYNLD